MYGRLQSKLSALYLIFTEEDIKSGVSFCPLNTNIQLTIKYQRNFVLFFILFFQWSCNCQFYQIFPSPTSASEKRQKKNGKKVGNFVCHTVLREEAHYQNQITQTEKRDV